MSQLLRHFRFSHHPFARSTPDEAVYRHRGFTEALDRLRFTVELDAIATLVAEPGCGKSLLLGQLADELQRQGWSVHYFAHATVGPFGLVNVLCRKVGLSPRRSRAETASNIAAALADDERHHLLMLDEGHRLPDATLEDLRLLTIGDFDRTSPFVLLLAGQPQLDDRLAEPIHHALDQRITTVARLAPLGPDETRQYIRHRLETVGAKKQPVFDEGALDALFDGSGGVPRRINNMATSSLIVAASRGHQLVSAQDVHDARLDRGRP
jgi:type II secretory pathway predicted ATPase ExeA